MKGSDFIRQRGRAEQLQKGLHLAHNAGHILAAGNHALIGAAADIAALSPGDAAHVIAVVGIAHGTGIEAIFNAAGGIPGNAAAVGDHIGVLGTGQAHVLHTELLQFQPTGRNAGIDLGLVPAVLDAAGIAARHAACEAFAIDAALDGAAFNAAVVLPGNAAHIVLPCDLAIKRTVFNTAVAGAHQAAHLAAAVIRLHPALQLQVSDAAAGLQIAEKALMGAVGSQDKVFDAVSAAVKAAGKAGNGSKGAALQVDVRIQLHLQALGIFHQGAVGGKGSQFLGRRDVQGFLCPIGAGQGQGQQQGRCQKQRNDLMFHSGSLL